MFIGLAAQGESTAVQQRTGCTISPGDDSEGRGRGRAKVFIRNGGDEEREGEGDNDAEQEREREREKGKQQQSDISTLACCLSGRQTQQLIQEFTS